MQVRVTLYGSLRRRLPPEASGGPVDIALPEGASLGDLKNSLGIPSEPRLLMLLNGSRCTTDARLAPGDEVVLAPMTGGG